MTNFCRSRTLRHPSTPRMSKASVKCRKVYRMTKLTRTINSKSILFAKTKIWSKTLAHLIELIRLSCEPTAWLTWYRIGCVSKWLTKWKSPTKKRERNASASAVNKSWLKVTSENSREEHSCPSIKLCQTLSMKTIVILSSKKTHQRLRKTWFPKLAPSLARQTPSSSSQCLMLRAFSVPRSKERKMRRIWAASP